MNVLSKTHYVIDKWIRPYAYIDENREVIEVESKKKEEKSRLKVRESLNSLNKRKKPSKNFYLQVQ